MQVDSNVQEEAASQRERVWGQEQKEQEQDLRHVMRKTTDRHERQRISVSGIELSFQTCTTCHSKFLNRRETWAGNNVKE